MYQVLFVGGMETGTMGPRAGAGGRYPTRSGSQGAVRAITSGQRKGLN